MWEFRHLTMPDLKPHVQFLYNNSMKKDKKIRQIFLDMDGVLADFESKITEMLGKKVWNDDAGHDVYDLHKRELTSKHMFRKMDPLPDAWKLVDWCLNSGIHTEILTAAGTVNRELVVRDKVEWINITTNGTLPYDFYIKLPVNHYVFSIHFDNDIVVSFLN